MNNKSLVIVSAVSFSIALYGLEVTNLILFAIPCLILITILIVHDSWIPFLAILPIFAILFQGTDFSYIYGTDVHSAAMLTYAFKKIGFPAGISSVNIAWGFPGTPLLHIYTALVSGISGLDIIPSRSDRILLPAFLGPVFATLSVIFAILIARRVAPIERISTYVVPILLWIPMYNWGGTFRRQAIGYLLFSILAFSLVLYIQNRCKKIMVLIFVCLITIPISHHMTTVVSLGLLISAAIMRFIQNDKLKNNSGVIINSILLGIILNALWWLWSPGPADAIVLMVASISERFLEIFNNSGDRISIGVSHSLLTSFRKFVTKWIYQAILGMGISISLLMSIRKGTFKHANEILFLFNFGFLTGVMALSGLYHGGLDPYRFMTYFMIVGGSGIALVVKESTNSHKLISSAVLIMVILGGIMTPVYLVSDSQPKYKEGDVNKRLTQELYHASWWETKYEMNETITGDNFVKEVFEPMNNKEVESSTYAIYRNKIPNRPFIYHSTNNHVYSAWLYVGETGVVKIETKYLEENLQAEKGKLYTDGSVHLFNSD